MKNFHQKLSFWLALMGENKQQLFKRKCGCFKEDISKEKKKFEEKSNQALKEVVIRKTIRPKTQSTPSFSLLWNTFTIIPLKAGTYDEACKTAF
jgi:hypothetical protein